MCSFKQSRVINVPIKYTLLGKNWKYSKEGINGTEIDSLDSYP